MNASTPHDETDPPRQFRWTLRSMMIVIALIALAIGLAGLFIRSGIERERALRSLAELERSQAEAEAYRAQVLMAEQAVAARARTTAVAEQSAKSIKEENHRLRAEIEELRREVELLRKAAEKDEGP